MNDIDPKPTSEFEDFDGSSNAWASLDETRLLHLVELLREGDSVIVNDREQAITVNYINDRAPCRTVGLEGHGTRYTLRLNRDEHGYPESAEFGYPSKTEDLSRLKVTNRNPFNVDTYDQLLTEEMESTAVSHYRDVMQDIERKNLSQPADRLKTSITYTDDAFHTVKWALFAWIDSYRENATLGQSDYTMSLFQEALSLWERIRTRENECEFIGAEMGLIGAYLDYVVEDRSLSVRVPEAAVSAADTIRRARDPSMEDIKCPIAPTTPSDHSTNHVHCP